MPPGKVAGCNDRCRVAAWAAARPRVRRVVRHQGQSIKAAVFELMLDRQWRTVRAIATAIGCTEAAAGAKLRDLRKCPVCRRHCEKHPGAAYHVEPRRLAGSHEYEFQLQGSK